LMCWGWWVCWRAEILMCCVDVLICWWLLIKNWCVDGVSTLMWWLCWSVDDYVDVLMCWRAGADVGMTMTVSTCWCWCWR
jgi:hypothetical protein